MCISKNYSIASFATGVSGSLFLLKYGKAKYEASNRVIAILSLFVSLMQVIDYMMWTDLSCTVGSKILLHPNTTPKVLLSHPIGVYDNLRLGGTRGLNTLASIVGPILNHAQPIVVLVSALYYMKSSHLVPNSQLAGANVIYILCALYNYYHYVTTTSLCTGTNETGHLKWLWNNDIIATIYLVILFLNMVNYFYDINFRIASILLLTTLIISITKFNANIGELWCFLSVGIPYIVLLLQHTVL